MKDFLQSLWDIVCCKELRRVLTELKIEKEKLTKKSCDFEKLKKMSGSSDHTMGFN